MIRRNQTDETTVKRGALTILFIAAAVFGAFQAVRLNNPLLILLVFAFPVGVWMLSNPAAALLSVFLIRAAGLNIPGVPGSGTLARVLQIVVIGLAILNAALSGRRKRRRDPADVCLAFFLLVMGMHISARGFGVGSLGGSTYGGAQYIYLAVTFLFYFAASGIVLNERHVRILFFGGLAFAAIPFLVQASIFMTDGATAFLTRFIAVSTESIAEALKNENDGGAVRWASAGSVGTSLLVIALVVPAIRKRTLVSWTFIGVALFLILITGFRGQLISAGVLLFSWLVYESKNHRRTVIVLLLLGLLGWGMAILTVPFFPASAQRALSILPFVGDRIAEVSIVTGAQDSIDFRVLIWKMCWKDLPQYLLIGRGLAVDINAFAWVQAWWYGTADFLYHMHAYHSGFFSLIMDFGVVGFLAGTAFMWFLCRDAWRGVRKFCVGRNDLISRYYVFLSIQLTWYCIAYFLIFGHVTESFPQIIFLALLLRIFRRELERRDSISTGLQSNS